MGPVADIARRRAPDHPAIAAELARVRATLRQRVATLIGRDLGLGRPDIEATMVLGLARLLAGGNGPEGDG